MLDGQGADEQLAGYHPSFASFHSGLFRQGRITHLLKELVTAHERHQIGLGRQLANLTNATLPTTVRRKLHAIRGISKPDWLNKGFSQNHEARVSRTNTLNDLLSDQMASSTLPALLHCEDRSSMAFSVESRLPFLDYRLVELLNGLGDKYKIVDGETKWLLRRALSDVLPEKIISRQDKIGFATPERKWLTGPLKDFVVKGVSQAWEVFPELFSQAALQRHYEEMLAGDRPYDASLWRIISFAAWGRAFNVGNG